jgi:hypothetical protein
MDELLPSLHYGPIEAISLESNQAALFKLAHYLIFKQQDRRLAYRYVGHAFVQKERNSAIQSADLLAWQWFTDKKHQLEKRPR